MLGSVRHSLEAKGAAELHELETDVGGIGELGGTFTAPSFSVTSPLRPAARARTPASGGRSLTLGILLDRTGLLRRSLSGRLGGAGAGAAASGASSKV